MFRAAEVERREPAMNDLGPQWPRRALHADHARLLSQLRSSLRACLERLLKRNWAPKSRPTLPNNSPLRSCRFVLGHPDGGLRMASGSFASHQFRFFPSRGVHTRTTNALANNKEKLGLAWQHCWHLPRTRQ